VTFKRGGRRYALGLPLDPVPVPIVARCTNCHMDLASGDDKRVKRLMMEHIRSYKLQFGERHVVLVVAKPDEPLEEATSATT